LHKHNWEEFKLSDIIGGVDPDGVRFLKLFLIDYTKVFSESVNAGCSKCINNYLEKYKSKFKKMENNSQYILKKKYEGISLNDHSSVMVNNRNITEEYAKELLKTHAAQEIFDKYPATKKETVLEAETNTTTQAPRKEFKKRR
jgi:hypothetical protein